MSAKPKSGRNVGAMWPILITGSIVCCLGGCASTKQVLEKQVADLEREVVQLKAERTNLSARLTGMDDKLLLYEKRAEKCSEGVRERNLEVVRLTPDNSPAPAAEIEHEFYEQVPEADGKRPVLKLVGGSTYVPSGAPASAKRPLIPVGDGDNLGVVPPGSVGAGNLTPSGPMADFQEAYRAYTNGALDEALVRFGKFLGENPSHAYADNAMFWRGECYLAKGKAFKAIGEFERLIRRFPSSEKKPSALYRIGFAYDKLGDRAKAKEYYFKVVDRHPGTDAARKASRRVAAIREAGGRSAELLPTSSKR
jgi:tol-pal system protein YbgF